ncbi:MAG: cobalamin biosynthesis protein CobD [Prevotella sp.]|nr:cobalamin biosynthesis protein CobD [Prevotella sp.]
MTNPFALLIGWVLDLLFGDPQRLPHPVVGFGKMISWGEHRLNKGAHRKLKGALFAVSLILLIFVATFLLRYLFSKLPSPFGEGMGVRLLFDIIIIYFCLAGTTLIREVRNVFLAIDRSLEEGRAQVARIVGRDTSELSAQEVRTAALETLAENLSDGVIAPLFWLALLGTPGMLTYKMVNTFDSMIGYRTERYRDFGCWAASIDDVANYIPARLTALLMIISEKVIVNSEQFATARSGSLFSFVRRYGKNHASPNSGYPEAALAGILNCRFGGPHYYFGELFDKPYIGENDRELTTDDMKKAIRVNRTAEVLMVIIVFLSCWWM